MNVIENAEAVNKINRAHWDRIEIINKMQAYQELEMLDLSALLGLLWVPQYNLL